MPTKKLSKKTSKKLSKKISKKTSKTKYWGFHLMVDCAKCNKDAISNKDNILKFNKELLQITKMKPLCEPIICFQNKNQGNRKSGYSFAQIIYTSSITGHFINKSGNAYIDIFSCKTFNIEKTIECIKKYFEPTKYKIKFVYRDADKNIDK